MRLRRILLSLRSSLQCHARDLLDEILVTQQRQLQDGVVGNLQQLHLCLSELCVQYETKLQNISVVPFSGNGRPKRIINFALVYTVFYSMIKAKDA